MSIDCFKFPYRVVLSLVLPLIVAGMLVGCQSDGERARGIRIEAAGIVGDTTGPMAGRENILGRVQDLSAGPDGKLFVLDAEWQEIREYGPEGELVSSIMLTIGEGPGEIAAVHEFDVGSDGRFYLTSRQGRRITILSGDGLPVGGFSLQLAPTNLAVASDGTFVTGWWLTTEGNIIRKYSDEGEEEAAFFEKPDGWQQIARTGNFGRTAVTDRGTLIYSLPWPYRIVEYSADGEILREAAGQPSFSGTPRQGERGTVSTEQRSGGLAVLDSGHVINFVRASDAETWYADVFSPDLQFIRRIERETFGLERFRQVAAGGGHLYVSSSSPAPHVRRFAVTID